MKTAMTATCAVALFISSTFISNATASADISAERNARSAKIQALQNAVRADRMSRSAKIQALLDIARLKAEARKERRQRDRMRGKRTVHKNKY